MIFSFSSHIEVIKFINYFNIPIDNLSFKRDKKCFEKKQNEKVSRERKKILGINTIK